MPSGNDDVIIKRKKADAVIAKAEKTKAEEKSSKKPQKKVDFSKQFERNVRIFAVLLFLISILVLASIVSYTAKDEPSTEISFGDLFGLLRGNDAIILKAQATHNWLGLVGAVVSNLLINFTIGFWIIYLPFFLGLWAFSLYKNFKISVKVLKMSLFVSILAFLLSGTVGTLTKISWFSSISKEWVGVSGFFLSSVTSNLIGAFGSFLVFLTMISLTLVLGFKLSPEAIYKKSAEWIKDQYQKIISFNLFTKREKPTPNVPLNDNESQTVSNQEAEDSVEPARIIRRNINYQINKPDNSSDMVHPFLGKNVVPSASDDYIDNEEPFIEDEQAPLKKKDFNISINPIKSEPKTIEDIEDGQPKRTHFNKDYLKISEDEISMEEASLANDIESEDEIIFDEENENELLPNSKKPLVVTLQEKPYEEPVPENVLSTWIHDQEIDYRPPGLNLLIDDGEQIMVDEDELKSNAKILQEKLETFKIFIENMSVTPGPVVTQYEFVPAAGIKISRIESLSDDIAMALKAPGIRIIAPVPGKGTVGIEIPNRNPVLVRFGSVIKSPRFNNSNFRLPIVLGKTISGEVYATDLTKMPHLLIAGATGKGKSVGINTIIASLIYKIHPKNLKFVIIDPKKVELRQYSALEKHFLAVSPEVNSTIITDPQDAIVALKAVCAEMDLRYGILASAGQRNIFDYNKKVAEGGYKNAKDIMHRQLPFIVVVIDELADLMMTASKEVEAPIIRIAQLARAVGIHLVVATQRPSVDVITGIIKANFPARISYKVASKVDSRTILDGMGAEQLLGNGDLLFMGGGTPEAIRIQNSFISTEEVENICEFIGKQKGYSQPYMLPSLNDGPTNNAGISKEDRDPLFEESARIVIRHQQASVSLIQRRMKVGYARAGRIVDELEAAGVIGPYDGSKARSVLLESEMELEAIL